MGRNVFRFIHCPVFMHAFDTVILKSSRCKKGERAMRVTVGELNAACKNLRLPYKMA